MRSSISEEKRKQPTFRDVNTKCQNVGCFLRIGMTWHDYQCFYLLSCELRGCVRVSIWIPKLIKFGYSYPRTTPWKVLFFFGIICLHPSVWVSTGVIIRTLLRSRFLCRHASSFFSREEEGEKRCVTKQKRLCKREKRLQNTGVTVRWTSITGMG